MLISFPALDQTNLTSKRTSCWCDCGGQLIQLPAEQRDAFALSFEDEAGEDLFTILRAAEIVNWDEIARGMGRSVQEVVQLRGRMPMNGASVAEELGASRENVYKWRFRAIRR